MKKFTYEISFLTSVNAEDEDKALEALERKHPRNNGRVSFHNIDGDEIYFTLFEVRDWNEWLKDNPTDDDYLEEE